MNKKPSTLDDIARMTGLNESSVSRALQDHPRISVETRNRVKEIAQKLNYEYNAHARSLTTRRSANIGVIVPNFGERVNHTYYLELLISDLRTELAKRQLDMVLCGPEFHERGRANLSRLALQGKVDGLLIVAADLPEQDRKVIEKKHIPMVLVNSRSITLSGSIIEGLPSFFTNNRLGGQLAAEHLIERGCRNLLCLADAGGEPEMHERTEGFVRTAEAAGTPVGLMRCTSYFDVVRAFVTANQGEIGNYDGIFCHTDLMACAVMRSLQAAGKKIPEDCRIVGFDDVEVGTYFEPRLTTIHQPREVIAAQAISYLVEQLGSAEVVPIVNESLRPRLVVREST